MIADLPKPFLFIHIPKTAGTSMEKALVLRVLGVSDWNSLDVRIRRRHALFGSEGLQHAKLRWFEKRRFLEGRFVFTIVRNPFDRALSEIHYLRRRHGVFAHASWKANLMEFAETAGYVVNHDLGACQVDWITDASGRIRCDEIVRFEDLGRGVNRVWKALRLGGVQWLPHWFDSGRIQPWREFYDSESEEAIRRKYERDFDELGYPARIDAYKV